MINSQSTYAIILLFASIATLYAIRAQHAHYLPDVYALALALLAPRQGYALAAVVLFVILRHTPLAMGLSGGLPEWALWALLPGAVVTHMSIQEDAPRELHHAPVSIPVSSMAYQPPPHGADIADMDAETDALRRLARDITDEQLLILICELRTPDGKFRHSANEVYRRVGGDRNAVLAQIKAIREQTPPPQYLQPDATTAPATYPVTKRKGVGA